MNDIEKLAHRNSILSLTLGMAHGSIMGLIMDNCIPEYIKEKLYKIDVMISENVEKLYYEDGCNDVEHR